MACGMLTDPPEAFTTSKEVPAANPPADVSIDLAVIVLPFAVRAPPLATLTVLAVSGRFDPDVVRVVVPVPPRMTIVFATRPRVAIVNTTVEDPPSKTTELNSLPLRLAPPKVIVWSVDALKVTVADPEDHEAEVDAFVQFPETVHASEPNAMYDAAEETSTFPVIDTLPEAEVREPPANVRFPLTVSG